MYIVYLVLVIFVRSSPHWQEDLSQGDQGETRQSTGQSMLQEDDDDGCGGDSVHDVEFYPDTGWLRDSISVRMVNGHLRSLLLITLGHTTLCATLGWGCGIISKT